MTLHELLETVRRVEIKTNRLVNDTMVGAYLSHFKGRGMDFEELRDYIPGDDVRDIDWNVTYRMGRPFIKRYREERELGMLLAIDVSGSSAFGSVRRSKREFAAEVAATLAFSAARSSDKVGLLLFTDQVELYVPPRKGRRHILRLIREMLFFQPRRTGTDLSGALAFVNRVGALAEEQGHHPDIYFTWGKVRIELSTHKIKGLSESDLILAAKIDKL